MAKEIVAMILAGGRGSRLYALTQKTAKPAVSFGGKYRIVDFPLSNCVNSSIDTVGIANAVSAPEAERVHRQRPALGPGPSVRRRPYPASLSSRPRAPTGTRALQTPSTRTSASSTAMTRSMSSSCPATRSASRITPTSSASTRRRAQSSLWPSWRCDWKEASRFGLMVADEDDKHHRVPGEAPGTRSPIWLPWASTSSTGMS